MAVPKLGRNAADPPDDVLDRLDRTTRELQQHLDDLIGMYVRDRYAERPGFFSDLVEHPVTVGSQELSGLLKAALAHGRIAGADADRVLLAGIVIRGGAPEVPTYLVVEVSRKVTERDVRRAVRRASILRDAGYDARPVVAGEKIRRSAVEAAQRLGVGRMFECEFDGEDPVIDDDAI